MSNDLTNEGSINFWIRIRENPMFMNEDSNIAFMKENDIGGIKLTILKEKNVLRVIQENIKYGIARLEADILKLLKKDMMVTITWNLDGVKLYLNTENVSESKYI